MGEEQVESNGDEKNDFLKLIEVSLENQPHVATGLPESHADKILSARVAAVWLPQT